MLLGNKFKLLIIGYSIIFSLAVIVANLYFFTNAISIIVNVSFFVIFLFFVIHYIMVEFCVTDNKYKSNLITENLFIKRRKKKYVNWEAISSIVTCMAIGLSIITGFLSVQLSSKSLEISRSMKDISEEMKECTIQTTSIQMTSSYSDTLLNGNIIFDKEDIKESETILKNFHSYFCSIMNVSDDVLVQLANINFREAYNENDYFKERYGFDDNLIYVVKFYFQKYQYILKYNKYFNMHQMMQEYFKKMDLYERILRIMDNDKEVIAAALNIYVPKEIICILYKLNYLNPSACEQYFPEVYKDRHETEHQNEAILFQQRFKNLEKIRNDNNPEYILFKNMMDYRILHQNPIGKDENVKNDTM